MGIKQFFRKLFKKEPKKYFTYKMICRYCDIIVTRHDMSEKRCPSCGGYMEVYDAEPLKEKIYDSRI